MNGETKGKLVAIDVSRDRSLSPTYNVIVVSVVKQVGMSYAMPLAGRNNAVRSISRVIMINDFRK
jgi:methyl coenzyme M reductase beta subunit